MFLSNRGVECPAGTDVKGETGWAVSSATCNRDVHPKNELKLGDVMIVTIYVTSAVVLALFSALWVRITRRDLETARTKARLAHLDWRPGTNSKQKSRRTLRR